MEYHSKYDAHNMGTRYVFDFFYTMMKGMGIKSNLVACCGNDYKTYERYASMICSTPKSKALFFENDKDKFTFLKNGVTSSKVKVKFGNIFHYPDYEEDFHARVEDIGIGLGLRFMISHATGRLYNQSRKTIGRRIEAPWKAQILDSALRRVPDTEVLYLYKHYLYTIGLDIVSINGKGLNNKHLFGKENGKIVKKYHDKKGRDCSVYFYPVELAKNDRQAKLFLFSCVNGSRMLQSLLIYK